MTVRQAWTKITAIGEIIAAARELVKARNEDRRDAMIAKRLGVVVGMPAARRDRGYERLEKAVGVLDELEAKAKADDDARHATQWRHCGEIKGPNVCTKTGAGGKHDGNHCDERSGEEW